MKLDYEKKIWANWAPRMEILTFMQTFWYFKVPEQYIQYLGLHRVNITPPPTFEDSLKVAKPTIWLKTRVHALDDYSDVSELLSDTKNLRSSLQHSRGHMVPQMTSKMAANLGRFCGFA